MRVLGIETSCDETAVSVLDDNAIIDEYIASQIDIHAKFGGVVPELASREHLKKINILLDKLSVPMDSIDAIGVTSHPGLEGSLLVGKTVARTISSVKDIPLIEIDHLEAHMFAARFVKTPAPPGLVLLVSGGHTRLIYVREWGNYEVLGETLDDAVGESFDKVSSILNLGYPGGPAIEKKALNANPDAFKFPVSRLMNPYAFSYSGIKTAVLYKIKYDLSSKLDYALISDIAASFQKAAIKPLINNSIKAAIDRSVDWIFVCGGVAANSVLREQFSIEAASVQKKVYFPEKRHCTDNASMVASCALFKLTGDSDFQS